MKIKIEGHAFDDDLISHLCGSDGFFTGVIIHDEEQKGKP